jgi:hypothetical protein
VYRLLYLILNLSSGKLSHFISSGLEVPNGGGGAAWAPFTV